MGYLMQLHQVYIVLFCPIMCKIITQRATDMLTLKQTSDVKHRKWVLLHQDYFCLN